MSLAKRLEEAAREGRITEAQADRILARRAELWAEKQPDGQMLLCFTDTDDPKYQRAKRELEALRTTGSTDSLIFSPLLRAAKPQAGRKE